MRVLRLFCAVATAVFLPVCVHAREPDSTTRATIDKAVAAVEARRYDVAAKALRPIADAPGFKDLEAATQFEVLAALAFSSCLQTGADPCFADTVRATELAEAPAVLWRLRATAATNSRRRDDALRSLQHIAAAFPGELADLDDLEVGLAVIVRNKDGSDGGLDAAGSATLEALRKADWRPIAGDGRMSTLWRHNVLWLIEAGDLASAKAALVRVVAPRDLVAIAADKRFDPITEGKANGIDLAAASARMIADYRRALLIHPDLMDLRLELALALRANGEAAEGLKLLDETIALSPKTFSDNEDRRAWAYDGRAHLLIDLGRFGEAVRAYDAGRKLPGGATSQALNLAALQVDRGRYADALKLTETAPAMNVYGRSSQLSARACAHAGLAQSAALAADLEALRGLQLKDPVNLQAALLCAGREDEAAQILIDRLRDPASRGRALVQVQTLARHPTLTPGAAQAAERTARLRARADLQAAISEIGRIGAYPVYLLDD